MKSRYDRNQELYEKVKNNDFEDYNQQVKDFSLEFDAKDSRKQFHEKKRLSVYFKDIDTELESANTKLNSIGENTGLEIKKDVDLKSLIEQAKKNHREQGGNIFSNTQYEILSSLNVEENVNSMDEEDRDLILEDIIGQTKKLNLEEELIFDDSFGNSIVDLKVIDEFYTETKENFYEGETVKDEEVLETEEVEELKEETTPESEYTDFKLEEIKDVELEEYNDEEVVDLDFDFEEELDEVEIPEQKIVKKEEVKEEKAEVLSKDIVNADDKNTKEKSEKWLTILLVFLIVSLIVVGLVIVSQYVGGF